MRYKPKLNNIYIEYINETPKNKQQTTRETNRTLKTSLQHKNRH